MEIVEFLTACLDEDERIARAVRVPHDWHQGPGGDPEWTDAEMVCMWPPEFHTPYERDKHWRGLGVEGAELAAHIAAHDPARVLREIDAKRRQVGWCVEVIGERDLSGYGEQGFLRDDPDALAVTLAVETLRLLASVFSDRPGCRSEWAP